VQDQPWSLIQPDDLDRCDILKKPRRIGYHGRRLPVEGSLLKKYSLFFLTVVPVLLIDQLTKTLVHTHMTLYESRPLIEGLFSLTYIRNPGAAFGFLSGAAPLYRSLFLIAVTLVAIILILLYLGKNRKEPPLLIFSLALILSGAVGNLIDRIRFGEVIDFLDVYVGAHHWPAFNVADSAISVGAALMIWEMVKRRNKTNLPLP
jgi:signal peptidase II